MEFAAEISILIYIYILKTGKMQAQSTASMHHYRCICDASEHALSTNSLNRSTSSRINYEMSVRHLIFFYALYLSYFCIYFKRASGLLNKIWCTSKYYLTGCQFLCRTLVFSPIIKYWFRNNFLSIKLTLNFKSNIW